MPDLGNLITAMVTPFDAGLNVDYDRVAELAVRLADAGSDILVSGTTGESPHDLARREAADVRGRARRRRG
jgi:4-hydroxy-tetrahydrodipicolinate synthase